MSATRARLFAPTASLPACTLYTSTRISRGLGDGRGRAQLVVRQRTRASKHTRARRAPRLLWFGWADGRILGRATLPGGAMNGRFLLMGTVVTAIALFAWQSISNAVIPWHMAT